MLTLALVVLASFAASPFVGQIKTAVIDATSKTEAATTIEEVGQIAQALEAEMNEIAATATDADVMSAEDEAAIAELTAKYSEVAAKKITEFGGTLAESEFVQTIKAAIQKAISSTKAATSVEEIGQIAQALEAEMNEVAAQATDADVMSADDEAAIAALSNEFATVAQQKIEELQ